MFKRSFIRTTAVTELEITVAVWESELSIYFALISAIPIYGRYMMQEKAQAILKPQMQQALSKGFKDRS